MSTFLGYLNMTYGGLIVLGLTLFVIEWTAILGRQHQKDVARTKFSLWKWLGDWVNWMTLLANLATAIVLISIREGLVEFGGLKVEDKEHFELFFAAVVGIVGQVLWRRLLSIAAALANGIGAPTVPAPKP